MKNTTTETVRPRRRIGRSVLALLAGFVTVVILSLGTDFAMHAAGFLPAPGQAPSDGALFVALVYRTVYTIAGSYIVARLAPSEPMRHAVISGLVGLALSIAGAVATWNGGPEFGAKWYALAVAGISMPCAWAGGKIFETRSARGTV